MTRIEGEIVIDRPVDEVFDFVADARNEPRYNPRMLLAEKLSPGPIGLGTRFRDEIRSMGRPAEITIEIVGYDRPRRLTNSIHMSTMDVRGGLTFDPTPTGTRMRWAWELMPRGVFRLMTPVIARIGRRMEQRVWASLKRVMEAQAAPSSTAGLQVRGRVEGLAIDVDGRVTVAPGGRVDAYGLGAVAVAAWRVHHRPAPDSPRPPLGLAAGATR